MFLAISGIIAVFVSFAIIAMNPQLMLHTPALLLFMIAASVSLLLLMVDAFVPFATKVFLGRILNKDFLLVITPAKRLHIYAGKLDDNLIWLKDKLAYLISSPDDSFSFAGRKAFLAYSGTAYTLNPRALAELAMLKYKTPEEKMKVYNEMLKKFDEIYGKLRGVGEEHAEEKQEVSAHA